VIFRRFFEFFHPDLYLYGQRYYRQTSREVKRLSSISKSPVYAHFSESIAGLSSIRAFCVSARFVEVF
jgi:ATP-binding cassette subfamily C (CFTR/MRP) protein 10